MRCLAGSLADGVLPDSILISTLPPLPPTNIRMVRGPRKSMETSNRKTIYQYVKKRDVGMSKCCPKKYGNTG